jgi:hypothetical protein
VLVLACERSRFGVGSGADEIVCAAAPAVQIRIAMSISLPSIKGVEPIPLQEIARAAVTPRTAAAQMRQSISRTGAPASADDAAPSQSPPPQQPFSPPGPASSPTHGPTTPRTKESGGVSAETPRASLIPVSRSRGSLNEDVEPPKPSRALPIALGGTLKHAAIRAQFISRLLSHSRCGLAFVMGLQFYSS